MPLISLQSPRQNLFLAALPEKDYEHLKPSLEFVPMPEGWAVYEDGAELDSVYFPATCTISLLSHTNDGLWSRLAVIGNEGLFGISMLMGRKTTPSRAVVSSGGYGYRLKAANLRLEFELASPLRYSLERYTRGLRAKIAQGSLVRPIKPIRPAGPIFPSTLNSAALNSPALSTLRSVQ